MANIVKKICIDSRFADPSSRSNTDFRYILNDSVHISDHTKMFVTDVCIPRTWYTIEYFNENLLVRTRNTITEVVTDYKIQLTHQNYTLETLREPLEFKLTESIPQIAWQVLSFPPNGRITISTESI